MGQFDEIRKRLPVDANVTRLTSAEVDALRQKDPRLPQDYLAFLAMVGFGDLGELQLHSGPSTAASFYSPTLKHLEHVVVFGDDKQGYCFGFDRSNGYRVVEISPSGEVDLGVESDFTRLLEGYFR